MLGIFHRNAQLQLIWLNETKCHLLKKKIKKNLQICNEKLQEK